MPGADGVDGNKLSADERAKASKWVSHQAQSIVRKATLILMVSVERILAGRCAPPFPPAAAAAAAEREFFFFVRLFSSCFHTAVGLI